MTAPARGGVILIVAFVVMAALNYALGLLLAWILPPYAFGHVSVLLAILYLTAIVLDAGFPWTLTRAISRRSQLSRGVIDEAVISALFGNLLFAVVIGLLVVGLQRVGGFGIPRELDPAILVVAVTLPVFAFNAIIRSILHGSTRFGALGAIKAGEVAVKVLVVGLLIVAVGATASVVALGVLGGAVGAAFVGGWLARDHRPRIRTPSSGAYLRAAPMFVGTVSIAAMLTIDVLILGWHGGAVAGGAVTVAVYQVGSMLARLPYFLGDALINAVFPYMSRRHDSTIDSHAYFAVACRWALIMVLPIETVLLLNPTPILDLLFPATYGAADAPVRVLAVAAPLALATVFFGKGLQAIGRIRATAFGAGIGLVVELVLLLLLVPRLGAMGAALGFLGGTASASSILGFLYLRHQDRRLFNAHGIIRHAATVAAMAVPLVASRGTPTWVGLASIVAACALYGVAALAVRLVSWHEVRRYAAIAGAIVYVPGRAPR